MASVGRGGLRSVIKRNSQLLFYGPYRHYKPAASLVSTSSNKSFLHLTNAKATTNKQWTSSPVHIERPILKMASLSTFALSRSFKTSTAQMYRKVRKSSYSNFGHKQEKESLFSRIYYLILFIGLMYGLTDG